MSHTECPTERGEETIPLMPKDKTHKSSDHRLAEGDRYSLATREKGSVLELRRRLGLLCGFNEVHLGEAPSGAGKKKKKAGAGLRSSGPNLVHRLNWL